jgi:hypothetical protein
LKTYGIAKSTDGGTSFGGMDGFRSWGMDWPQPDCEGTMRMVQSATGMPCFTLAAPYGNAIHTLRHAAQEYRIHSAPDSILCV